MIAFTTPVALPKDLPRIDHVHQLLLMGSCFATEIGDKLRASQFRCEINPFGVLYNPLSIANALRLLVEGTLYTEDSLFFYQERWHSSMHHSDFSSADKAETLTRINSRLTQAAAVLPDVDELLITFGTAWVYEKEGVVVGNCHKLPEKSFVRRMLSVEEIVEVYRQLIPVLQRSSPALKVLFTVSPIRHVRDGLHANNLSKATLLLAVQRLQQLFPQTVCYFPAYEIVLDELRDYRFFAEDLVHPNRMAVEYVWQRFAEACFNKETTALMQQCEEIDKMLNHKPFNVNSLAYQQFMKQIVLKIERLNEKMPYLVFSNELELCRTRLKQ